MNHPAHAASALLALALLAAVPARAQGAGGSTASPVTPSAPSASDATPSTPPDIVKPRSAGPGDSAAGVIHPGPSGDAGIHVPTTSPSRFPTPVIRPQDLHGNAVVPK